MKKECRLLKDCSFFTKFKEINNLACQGFIHQYCRGPKMNECKRKQYLEKHGTPPPDDMMPNGQMVKKKE